MATRASRKRESTLCQPPHQIQRFGNRLPNNLSAENVRPSLVRQARRQQRRLGAAWRTQIQNFPAFLSDHLPLFRVSSNSKCFFVPSGFSISHVSLLIATPQKSRSSRLSDDLRGPQNSFGNESPAVYIPVSSDNFTWRIEFGLVTLRDERQAHHGRT